MATAVKVATKFAVVFTIFGYGLYPSLSVINFVDKPKSIPRYFIWTLF